MTTTATLEDLRDRVRQVQDSRRVSRPLRTLPALAGALPGGTLRTGSAYAVESSTSLAMAMLAGPSADGAWCGVVGVPEFGVEAAAGLGIALDRLVLVPDPGDAWLSTTAALVDALTVVMVRPPARVYQSEAARLAARLRQSDAMLIALGEWPQCEARLSVTESRWIGIKRGYGHLRARQVVVTSTGRSGRPERTPLWLPGPGAAAEPMESAEPLERIEAAS